VSLPQVETNGNGSITDSTDNTLLIFTCHGQSGTLRRSVAGVHIEVGDIRVINSVDLRLETVLVTGKTYKIPIKYKGNSATLILKHDD
jgi:hypothetical protein